MAGSWLSAGGTPGLAWALVCALALGLALLVDWYLGEPPLRLHPVVWMGRYLGWAGPHIAPLTTADPPPHAQKRRSFWLGALAWCTGAGAVGALAWWLQSQLQQAPWWLAAPLLAVLLKPLLAWRMLRDEVLAVERALARSLPEGREQLARLVSRDVSQLTPAEVRESAIESLAENLNDSVVAPVFWFVLLGLPGAAIYRFANTADAMWGYPGSRGARYWQWAGKWAARLTMCSRGCPRASPRCCWRHCMAACPPGRWPKRRAKPHRPTAAGPWPPWPWRWVCGWPSRVCTPCTRAGMRRARCTRSALRLMGKKW